MKKLYTISIFLSFMGLWISSYLSGDIEIVLGFILIFSFGLLHGSNDVLLIHKISEHKHSLMRVLFFYVLTVFLAVVTFYIVPIVALSLFIIFSAFHFGEQHYEHYHFKIESYVLNTFYFFYGMLVLQILFILNSDEVISIVNSIAHILIDISHLKIAFFTGLFLFLSLGSFMAYASKSFRSIAIREVFYLLIFGIIFKVSTLIWSFTIYFIFWHSFPSIYEQVSFLYQNFNKNTLFQYSKKAFPYWIFSLFGVSIIFYIFRHDEIFYAIFFSFIAAITFPHALVINKMFYSKRAKKLD